MKIEAIGGRIEAAEIQFWVQWVKGLKQIDGDPYGAEVIKFGDATACLTNTPSVVFNRFRGPLEADAETVDRIVSMYHARGMPSVVELSPYGLSMELSMLLAKRGFIYVMPLAQTYLVPTFQQQPTVESDIEIRELRASEPDEYEAFCRIQSTSFAEGFALSDAQTRDTFGQISLLDGYTCYLARIGDDIVGAAALFRHDNVGVLVAGATLPSFRQRGVQTALLAHRAREAWAYGCDVVTATALVGSNSLRNMERIGMRKAADKVILFNMPPAA